MTGDDATRNPLFLLLLKDIAKLDSINLYLRPSADARVASISSADARDPSVLLITINNQVHHERPRQLNFFQFQRTLM